jgi:Mycoplasma protein of unknown function, DUF285
MLKVGANQSRVICFRALEREVYSPLLALLTTDMSSMFSQCTMFNQNLSLWDTGNVQTFAQMFVESGFNGDISTWSTGKVTSLASVVRLVCAS